MPTSGHRLTGYLPPMDDPKAPGRPGFPTARPATARLPGRGSFTAHQAQESLASDDRRAEHLPPTRARDSAVAQDLLAAGAGVRPRAIYRP